MGKSKAFQSYNGRMGRWVYFSEPGKIKKTSEKKFSGVPVRGGNSKASKNKSPVRKKTAAQQSPPANGWPQMWLWEWI